MKNLLLITAIVIIFSSCKKEETGKCISETGEVTFWLDSKAAQSVGYNVEMNFFIDNELIGTSNSQVILMKAPTCGQHIEGVIHTPAKCGSTYLVKNVKTNDQLFKGTIDMGANNCLILKLE
jgi:hypothetical protein